MGEARSRLVLLVRILLLPHISTSSDIIFTRFKLLLDPTSSTGGDSELVIRTKALERGVLALPGTVFLPSGHTSAYVRASFSINSEEEIEEALRRLAQVVLDARVAVPDVPAVKASELEVV
jgi:tryptophan aminotransferase